MLADAIKLITVNRDAVATNRGFYFQYLKLLERWLENFVANRNGILYSEVDDDMKEVNGELIFTQFKCYTSTFSLNSKEIKTALLAFYAHFLGHKDVVPVRFEFVTNTSIGKNEKLLREWIETTSSKEVQLRDKFGRRIRSILEDEIKRSLNGKLLKIEYSQLREELISKRQLLIESISENINEFIDSIKWDFSDLEPEKAIEQIFRRLILLLSDSKFQGKSPGLLLDVLLSEIYRKSQNVKEEDRKLDNELILTILKKTDKEMEAIVEAKFMALFRNEIVALKSQIKSIKLTQEEHGKRLDAVEQSIKEEIKCPKDITLIPFLDSTRIVQRQEVVRNIDSYFESLHHLNICGAGGMGKSTVAKIYLHQHYEEFDHVIWLDVKQGIIPSVVVNDDISLNLDLRTTGEDKIFNTFLNKLNRLHGRNLIVLDNLKADKLVFQQLASLKNWKILSTSRYKNENCHNYVLATLSFGQAMELFTKYCDQEVDEKCFLEFLEFIQYNTLMVELAAKTIANSLDLTLMKLLDYMKKQELDAADLAIDIELGGPDNNVQIFTSLLATFAVSDLSDHELFLLEFFSILPSEDISIVDLIDMAGESNRSGNTSYFINNINQLAKKGWIEKAENKFSMHRLVQQSIIYSIRKSKSFIGFFFFINWLGARFSEAHKSSPKSALRFLKYGESILHAIKEPYRKPIYQPLLILENEVLLVYALFMLEVNVLQEWQDLYERASNYLKDDDPILGTILCNFGMSLVRNDRMEEAESCYLKACELFEKDEKLVGHLVTTKINLSIFYAEQRNFTKVRSLMIEISTLRKKHNFGNNTFTILEGNALAYANDVAGNIERAEEIYELLGEVFFEIPEDQRNIMHYAEAMCNYSVVLLKLEKLEKAIGNQVKTIRLLEESGIGDDVTIFRRNVELLYMIYMNNDMEIEGEKLKEKYVPRAQN